MLDAFTKNPYFDPAYGSIWFIKIHIFFHIGHIYWNLSNDSYIVGIAKVNSRHALYLRQMKTQIPKVIMFFLCNSKMIFASSSSSTPCATSRTASFSVKLVRCRNIIERKIIFACMEYFFFIFRYSSMNNVSELRLAVAFMTFWALKD